MAKQVLVETLTQPGLTLVESANKELAPGVLCVLEGQIGTFDLENANKRTYPKALWENVINNDFVKEQLANRSLYGEADHPESLESSVTRVSHCMRRIWLDEASGQVRGRLDILDTPAGRIVNTLARYGNIGISSRGSGELSILEGRSVVDASTYEYITHDIVVQPACEGSYPSVVTENFKRTIKADIITDEVNRAKNIPSVNNNQNVLVMRSKTELFDADKIQLHDGNRIVKLSVIAWPLKSELNI